MKTEPTEYKEWRIINPEPSKTQMNEARLFLDIWDRLIIERSILGLKPPEPTAWPPKQKPRGGFVSIKNMT